MKQTDYVKLIARLNQGNPTTGGLANLRTALNMLPLNKIDKVLEIGCNTGSSTIALGEMLPNSEVIGMDIDSDMIKMAKKNIIQADNDGIINQAKVSVEVADAQKLPYPNNTFDLVVSSGTLSFINNPELAIKDIYRVLKPGGFLLTLDYYAKENRPTEIGEEISAILGIDANRTTLDYWIKLHTSQPFNFEGLDIKSPFMHSMPIKTKLNNIKSVLAQQNHSYSINDLNIFEKHLEVFKKNEEYVGVVNILVRKLEILGLLSDGAN